MQDTPEERLPPSLRLLKALVIVLTLSMIGGVITVVWLLVTRMPSVMQPAQSLVLPADVALPAGAVPSAITQGSDWVGIVTRDGRMFIFNTDGSLRQEIAIQPAP